MEWVETTAKSVDEAKSAALDQLGVAADEAEFEVLEEPKPGLFGRTRGSARVRGRVRPAQVRPKNDRRRGRRRSGRDEGGNDGAEKASTSAGDEQASEGRSSASAGSGSRNRNRSGRGRRDGSDRRSDAQTTSNDNTTREDTKMNDQRDDRPESDVTPEEVGDAAVAFMEGLVDAFGAEGSTTLAADGTELDVTVKGADLGLLVGPRGRTLIAVQDLARVASQRRLGDHDTRLRIDVGGYRERRAKALAEFAGSVAEQVRESGVARSLEPMASADRKIVHDALNDEDGVESRSEGDDPNRYVVVVPA